MVGNRRTHDYPYGRPFPLVLLEIAMAILLLSWVVFVPGHWTRAIGLIAAVLVLALINTKLLRRYEQTGQAVRIPRPKVVARFPHGLPVSMLAARLAFFVSIAVMIVFGVAPVAHSTARIGIVVCVFALIGVAVLNLVLERHYVRDKDLERHRRTPTVG
jgi:membrane protein implicated in regulation of membrane protease activity